MNKKSIRLDLRIVCLVLLAVILGMLVTWRPWQQTVSEQKKITVTGTTTLRAEPDEYIFNPYYERNTIAEATALSSKIVSELESTGVDKKSIKTQTSSYDDYPKPIDSQTQEPVKKVNLQLTVTINNRELAEKVQAYLAGTEPRGAISPMVTFSETKRKELESKASEAAIADAKSQAGKRAELLGGKLGKAIEVKDELSFGYQLTAKAYDSRVNSSIGSAEIQNLGLQPGENELPYSVVVTFELR